MNASVVEMFARTPVKYMFQMTLKIKHLQVTSTGGQDHDPDELLGFLKRAAENADVVYMRSKWKAADEKYVVLLPPTVRRNYAQPSQGWWGGEIHILARVL